MDKIKCIIFDCDGVLVDSEAIGIQVLLSMVEQLGLKLNLEESIHTFRGMALKDCFLTLETLLNKPLPADFEKEYRRLSFNAFRNELQPVEGIAEFISLLKIPFCVASSGPVEKIKLNLSLVGLLDKFENHIFSSYQINSWKPEPDIYLHTAKEMGFAVDECIVIEDSKPGVIAAKTGGFTVFGFSNKHTAPELESAGADIFFSFETLYERLIAANLL